MSTIRTPPAVEAPGWWFDHDYQNPEIASFLNVPARTVEEWLTKARLAGAYPGQKRGRYRFYSAHHAYACALLAKLQRVRWRIDPDTIHAAFKFACDIHGTPRAPKFGEQWTVADDGGAIVQVDAWLAFVAVRAWAEDERMQYD